MTDRDVTLPFCLLGVKRIGSSHRSAGAAAENQAKSKFPEKIQPLHCSFLSHLHEHFLTAAWKGLMDKQKSSTAVSPDRSNVPEWSEGRLGSRVGLRSSVSPGPACPQMWEVRCHPGSLTACNRCISMHGRVL